MERSVLLSVDAGQTAAAGAGHIYKNELKEHLHRQPFDGKLGILSGFVSGIIF